MTDLKAATIICVASFFKGNDFIRECKRLGAAVVLLTREKLLDAGWARESLDDLIAIPGKTSVQSYLAAATYVARQRRVLRVVALEEYDIVTAAHIREHLGVTGMGTTVARCFQDKLAMRCKANQVGIAHVGLIVRSRDHGRVVNLLTEYARRFSEDFTAVAPAEETAEQHL